MHHTNITEKLSNFEVPQLRRNLFIQIINFIIDINENESKGSKSRRR